MVEEGRRCGAEAHMYLMVASLEGTITTLSAQRGDMQPAACTPYLRALGIAARCCAICSGFVPWACLLLLLLRLLLTPLLLMIRRYWGRRLP